MFGKLKEASKPSTNYVTLRELAESKNAKVRAAVGANKNTQSHVLENLAKDIKPKVRAAVATNPNLPSNVWEILSKDSDALVQSALNESHPSQPEEARYRG